MPRAGKYGPSRGTWRDSIRQGSVRWLALLSLVAAAGCIDVGQQQQAQRTALFVGIDVSGSFLHSRYYDDSLDFLSHYIWGHLNGAEGLYNAKEIFVGTIGGKSINEEKSFYPIFEFQGKSPEQIKARLMQLTPPGKADWMSDFSVFFQQVAEQAKKRNLSLLPITVVMLTDGIPAFPGPGDKPDVGHVSKIDVRPIEYISRNVTVRLLYADPVVSHKWETDITRRRVKMWTVDANVMPGWKAQLQPNVEELKQDKLWKWVKDVVDYRVTAVRFNIASKKARS